MAALGRLSRREQRLVILFAGLLAGAAVYVLAIEPVTVSGGFFVAIEHVAELNTATNRFPAAARFDSDASGANSWFFYDSPGEMPYDDLASAGFFSRMDNTSVVPIPGAFAIRAVAVPTPGGVALLALGGLAGVRRRR